MKNTPFIAVTSQPVPYHADTTAIFNTLCQQNSNSLLLDSAEIGSKNSLQSLILINAAVKMAKKYLDSSDFKYINAVLDKVIPNNEQQ